MKTAYFDCFAGISGDMTLGAFISLGVPIKFIKEKIAASLLNEKSFDIKAVDKKVSSISVKSVTVKVLEDKEERNLALIKSLIEKSSLSAFVKEKSILAFKKIAEAESYIHGEKIENIHFHELGGIDAIVDIVGTMLCVEYLEIEKVCASKIKIGTGFIKCAHGTLPAPSPAAMEILKNIPVIGSDIPIELTTPTGAAIIASLAESFGPYPEMIIKKTGYGAGKNKINDFPNLLRIVIGETSEENIEDIFIIKTTIDNMTGELFENLMEKLFENGALDVCFIPVYMKKNRPGIIVEILSKKDKKEALINTLFQESSSIGIRYYKARREVLKREETIIKTKFGDIKAKKITEKNGRERISPEYEECRRKANELNVPIKLIYETFPWTMVS